MKIINVIPIAKGITRETLSYWSTDDIPLGATIEVPLRKKIVPALVIASEEARNLKAEIKELDFEMRKIKNPAPNFTFSPAFIRAVKKTAEYFVSTTGSTLQGLVPQAILKNPPRKSASFVDPAQKNPAPIRVLQQDGDERLTHYKSIVRESFAAKKSVFLLVPTLEDGKLCEENLKRGVGDYTYFLHGGLSQKKIIELWREIEEKKHPLLIIATGTFLSIPRKDIGIYIVEREHSNAFKTLSRPFIDFRICAEFLAQESGADILYGDTLLSTEMLYRFGNGGVVADRPLATRLLQTNSLLINMHEYRGQDENSYVAISKEVRMLAEYTRVQNEHLFIFGSRKGYAPSTLCRDCGTIVTCPHCGAPVTLYKTRTGENNFFLCQRCGKRRSAEELCKKCGGWRLITLGIGIERISEELERSVPSLQIFTIDRDSAKNPKRAKEIAEQFYETPGSVLVGTEMALPYLNKKIEHGVVASIDPLFLIPDFRIHEKIFNILLSIRSLASKNFLIQTRDPEQKLFSYALEGKLLDFYQSEISERELLGYPPFSVLIKISARGDEETVKREIAAIKTNFAPYEPAIFPAFIAGAGGKYTIHALLKRPPKEWPDETLREKLLALPPWYEIKINPESLL